MEGSAHAAPEPDDPAGLTALDKAQPALLQYGALGVLALLAILAVRVLYKSLSDARDRETARADRLEQELKELNEVVRRDVMAALAQADRSVQDALAAVRRS